jgi:integrase/recombinase XerD
MAQATSLRPGQIRHLLRVTTATSKHLEGDTLVLLLGPTAGMRVTEIAQIEVQDVLFPSVHSAKRSACGPRSPRDVGNDAST